MTLLIDVLAWLVISIAVSASCFCCPWLLRRKACRQLCARCPKCPTCVRERARACCRACLYPARLHFPSPRRATCAVHERCDSSGGANVEQRRGGAQRARPVAHPRARVLLQPFEEVDSSGLGRRRREGGCHLSRHLLCHRCHRRNLHRSVRRVARLRANKYATASIVVRLMSAFDERAALARWPACSCQLMPLLFERRSRGLQGGQRWVRLLIRESQSNAWVRTVTAAAVVDCVLVVCHGCTR
jgi:hypothetical protein